MLQCVKMDNVFYVSIFIRHACHLILTKYTLIIPILTKPCNSLVFLVKTSNLARAALRNFRHPLYIEVYAEFGGLENVGHWTHSCRWILIHSTNTDPMPVQEVTLSSYWSCNRLYTGTGSKHELIPVQELMLTSYRSWNNSGSHSVTGTVSGLVPDSERNFRSEYITDKSKVSIE